MSAFPVFEVGDWLQAKEWTAMPELVQVLGVGVCDIPECYTGLQTIRIIDPRTGEQEWMHSAEFVKVTPPPMPRPAGWS